MLNPNNNNISPGGEQILIGNSPLNITPAKPTEKKHEMSPIQHSENNQCVASIENSVSFGDPEYRNESGNTRLLGKDKSGKSSVLHTPQFDRKTQKVEKAYRTDITQKELPMWSQMNSAPEKNEESSHEIRKIFFSP